MTDETQVHKRGNPPNRPPIPEEQYRVWLEDMRSFLVLGCSLHRAIERAGLLHHQTTIYDKYRVGDYFAKRVDEWRATPGENANEAYVMLIKAIHEKVKQGLRLDRDEADLLKDFTKYHRTAQPFFVLRTERAEAKEEDLGKIVDILNSDYAEFGQESPTTGTGGEATVKEVANDPLVQDQGQSGQPSDVSTKQDPT